MPSLVKREAYLVKEVAHESKWTRSKTFEISRCGN